MRKEKLCKCVAPRIDDVVVNPTPVLLTRCAEKPFLFTNVNNSNVVSAAATGETFDLELTSFGSMDRGMAVLGLPCLEEDCIIMHVLGQEGSVPPAARDALTS